MLKPLSEGHFAKAMFGFLIIFKRSYVDPGVS